MTAHVSGRDVKDGVPLTLAIVVICHFCPKGCFPAASKVSLENGKSVTMSELQVADKVKTGKALAVFLIFENHGENKWYFNHDYLELCHIPYHFIKKFKASLYSSEKHFIFNNVLLMNRRLALNVFIIDY